MEMLQAIEVIIWPMQCTGSVIALIQPIVFDSQLKYIYNIAKLIYYTYKGITLTRTRTHESNRT